MILDFDRIPFILSLLFRMGSVFRMIGNTLLLLGLYVETKGIKFLSSVFLDGSLSSLIE